MADRLKPADLRERAREHRQAAARDKNPSTRRARVKLAEEYERLADEIEATAKKRDQERPAHHVRARGPPPRFRAACTRCAFRKNLDSAGSRRGYLGGRCDRQ